MRARACVPPPHLSFFLGVTALRFMLTGVILVATARVYPGTAQRRYEVMLPLAAVAPNLDQGWKTAFANDAVAIKERWNVVDINNVPESQLKARDQLKARREDIVVPAATAVADAVAATAEGGGGGTSRGSDGRNADGAEQETVQEGIRRPSRPRTSFYFTSAADCNVKGMDEHTLIECTSAYSRRNRQPRIFFLFDFLTVFYLLFNTARGSNHTSLQVKLSPC